MDIDLCSRYNNGGFMTRDYKKESLYTFYTMVINYDLFCQLPYKYFC